MLAEFIKSLFQNQYLWVMVSGIFREEVYHTSLPKLYATSVAIPVHENSIEDFQKNPVDFLVKALQDKHPEMKGFIYCGSHVIGWFTSEEFYRKHPFNVKEVCIEILYLLQEAAITSHPTIPPDNLIKPQRVIYRMFNEGIQLPYECIIEYFRLYLQNTLETLINVDISLLNPTFKVLV